MRSHLIIILFLLFLAQQSFGQNTVPPRIDQLSPGLPAPSPTPDTSPDASSKKRPEVGGEDQPIRVNTFLVNLPVVASDRQGHYVPGLKKENFTIIQDGVSQEIAYFAGEQAPMSVVVLIDISFSTRDVLKNIKTAAREFVRVFRPEDQAMVVTFDAQSRVLTGFTSDHKKLNSAIERAEMAKRLGSNMQDAIYNLVTRDLADIKGRKAIIVLTDGEVLGTEISNKELLSKLAESDVPIYPIMYETNDTSTLNLLAGVQLPNGKTYTLEQLQKNMAAQKDVMGRFMDSLAANTGGRIYRNKTDDFKQSFQAIADELKNQYLLGYYPQNFDDGKPHRIVIETTPKEIVIRTKLHLKIKPAK